MYSQYKAHVAPIYQTEMERHLFATASFRRRQRTKSLTSAKVRRQLLRSRWVGRWSRWKAAPVSGNPTPEAKSVTKRTSRSGPAPT